MSNIGGVIKSIRDIFRKDPGLSGDAQRIEQLGWMIFLKLFDDKDKEKELLDLKYKSPIPEELQWRNWAENDEGITGDELINFVNNKLFPTLKELQVGLDDKLGVIIRNIFDGTNNYMKSGTTFRQAINKLNEIDFNSSREHHIFNAIYEDVLQGLATKKDTGEFYTPRAVTQFIVDMVNPQLGEKICDPACGTAGFLVCAIENLKKQVNNVTDRKTLQETVTGTELKPLPYMLSVVNLITHDIEIPQIENADALSRELTSIKQKDRVDIIVANPPFGGVVGDGMETNFPLNYRTKESADLFLILFIQLLKDARLSGGQGGRAGIVLPDGSLTGDGVKQRVRQKLLEDCNVHTIVRLPQSVFAPYATVNTNLIFFEKGKQTKEIWYYEHTLPEGQKAYSKTKPIRLEEFNDIKEWWINRTESETAWRVPIETIIERNYDLDIKNPNKVVEEVVHDKNEIISNLKSSFSKCQILLEELTVSKNQDMAKETSSLVFKQLANSPVGIISEFISNKISSEFGYKPLRNYFLEIQTGKTPPMSNPEYYASNDIAWIKPSDIGFEKYITATDWISNKAEIENKATIYKPNTILIICIGGGIGRLGIVDRKCSSNQQITGILFNRDVVAEYVYYYFLSRYKIFEENSSKSTLPIINQKGLGNLDFVCPNLSIQKEIVRYLDYCKECLDNAEYPLNIDFALTNEIFEFSIKVFKAYYTQKTLLSEYQFQLTQIENLNQAILQEAVQGKLVPQSRSLSGQNDEPASELLKRIKAEKAKAFPLWGNKKGASLPPIKPEEIPFEIPESWVWCRLFDIISILGDGLHGTPNYDPSGEYYFINGNNLINGKIEIKDNTKRVSENEYNKHKKELTNNTVFVSINGTLGNLAYYEGEQIILGKSACYFNLYQDIVKYYIGIYIKSSYFLKYAVDVASETTIKNVSLKSMRQLPIPLPPLFEQKRIVEEFEKQFAKTKQLKEHILSNQQATEQLLKALLHEAFLPAEAAVQAGVVNEAKGVKPEKKEAKVIAFKPKKCSRAEKAILAGHIINLTNNEDFGRVKFQKLLFLAEYHCNLDLESNYIQKVAGPHDADLIEEVESTLKRLRFYDIQQSNIGNHKVNYTALSAAAELDSLFVQNFESECVVIDGLLAKFKNSTWEQCEIVATLYAVWNNRIIRKELITDELLKQDFLNWDKQKIKYKDRIDGALDWMRKKEILPDGRGNYIDKTKKSKKSRC